jgi:hypothetical protein
MAQTHGIVSTAIAALGSALANKGLGFLTDIFVDLKDDGIAAIKDSIFKALGIDITNPDVIDNLTEDQVWDIKGHYSDNAMKFMEIQEKFRNQDLQSILSAREMQRWSIEVGPKSLLTAQNIVGLIFTVFGICFCLGIAFFETPASSQRYIDIILGGVVVNLFGQVGTFFLGGNLTRNSGMKTRSTDEIPTTTQPIQAKEFGVK